MKPGALRDEINKRLTLNWLIQGAAQHAGMTFHHLARDEFDALDPGLLLLYDQYALVNLLQYWQPEVAAVFGWPPRFWKSAASKHTHPFSNHPLLSRYGGMLAAAGRQRALERCKEKEVSRSPIRFAMQAGRRTALLSRAEAPHQLQLVDLAKKLTSTVWGIPVNRLDAELAQEIVLGTLMPARTFQGEVFRDSIVGYGHVVQRNDSLTVVARGTNCYLLTKELVKGTAELICLHGLNELDDDTYRSVLSAADWLEFEPWMLQTGGELWRRLLELFPRDRPLAIMLMQLARLPAKSLESLMLSVFERPDWARELLAGLVDPCATSVSDD